MDGADFDVAVAGGGPAGLAAALTLLRYTHRRVPVVESSEYDGLRVGIGHALTSGIHAARAAHQALEAEDAGTASSTGAPLLAGYCDQVARIVSQYLGLRRHFYAIEQRWAKQPFWRRRHQAPLPAGREAGAGAVVDGGLAAAP